MKNKKNYKTNLPKVRIDKSLEKYKDIVLFPEKLEKANKNIEKVGLPKIKKHLK